MNIVNCTSHTLNIYDESGVEVLALAPSGIEIRMTTRRELVGMANGIPLYQTKFNAPENVPPERAETIYVVPGMLRSWFDRPDFYQPGELKRDPTTKQPVGCVGLTR